MEIYLDNSATTKVAPQVAQLVQEMMTEDYGNPSSLHRKGFFAEQKLTAARRQIALVMGVAPEEITFTGSGTEANNLALLGYCRRNRRAGNKIITSLTEHESVLGPMKQLEAEGFVVEYMPPDAATGAVNPEALAERVDQDTLLVSVMAVNSETGALSNLMEISRQIRRKNPSVRLHVDAIQGFCKLSMLPRVTGVDLMTVSSHKIHGPKGVGALYAAKGVKLSPLYYGAAQEKGLRPGTENTPAICGFGLAAELMWNNQRQNWELWTSLAQELQKKCAKLDGVCINSPAGGAPYIMNLSIPGVGSEVMIHYLEEQGIYISSGSACSKGKRSHVLTAMGLPTDRIDGALRVSFSPGNTVEDVEQLCGALERGLGQLTRRKRGG